MIVHERIKAFERLGFGLFVHYGLYSVLGKGEWAMRFGNIPLSEYAKLTAELQPAPDWAKRLVSRASSAGCKYITLTARHHDGFSLYDTQGLNTFDAPHVLNGRDLVREFVDACRAENIQPFFYHTMLDWSRADYVNDFNGYLQYLRASVELLCKNYGQIGGIWFDGAWDNDGDWQEDALYSLIRAYQPNALVINNTGLDEQGALGHIELDSVTFERGKPQPINLAHSPKYLASEMCQVLGGHWGYAKLDFAYRSLVDIIEDFCACRRYGANFLLNVGPMGNGYLRPLDAAMLSTLGEWTELHREALYLPRPCAVELEGESRDFLLARDKTYYLFCHGMRMRGDPNVVLSSKRNTECVDAFRIQGTVTRVTWLDDGSPVRFTQEGTLLRVEPQAFDYGSNLVVRIAKIETE